MNSSYATLCSFYDSDRRAALTQSLITRYQWTPAQARRAIDEYLMFLTVAAQPKRPHPVAALVPTQEVDCVWEADILQNTAQYMQTCEQFCGRVIHHGEASELQKMSTFNSLEQACGLL